MRRRAAAALQHLLQYDAVSASVRERMLKDILFDPPLYGLLHASAAAAHCDGACKSASVACLEAHVQPGADRSSLGWLRDVALEVCTRSEQTIAHVCACRRGLLRRLVHGPDWPTFAQMPRRAAVTLAAQPPGTPGRRFIIAVRLLFGDESIICSAPRCRLKREYEGNSQGLYTATYTAAESLPYQSGDLDARFGLIRSSADAFVAQAAAADTWVHCEKSGTDHATVSDGRGLWRMHVESNSLPASVLRRRSSGITCELDMLASQTSGVRCPACASKTLSDQPVWACMWAQEIEAKVAEEKPSI